MLAGFEEDRETILAQQRMLEMDPDFPRLAQRMDSAPGLFRQLMQRLIAAENATKET